MNLKGLEKLAPPSADPSVSKDEGSVLSYVTLRVAQMKDFRKQLKVEDDWKEADREYVPSELDLGKPKKRLEQSDETGWRSKFVGVTDSDEDWRSQNSDPTLLAKIQTAISILVDQDPEATLKSLLKKFEKRTALALSLWRRNWNISGSKEVYKKFIFNLAKYGWAPGRSFPHKIAYDKEVLTEVNFDDPSKNVYEQKKLVWYNDVDKEALNPYRTWIDEQSKPYDDYSTNEVYFEKDYSYDQAYDEFSQFDFAKLYPEPKNLKVSYTEDGSESGKEDEFKQRQDIVTIGFFESRLRDLYAIVIPKDKKVLHFCPLPNDDGLLSVWQAPWVLRDVEHPYGISIWKIIKQKKTLYDKMQNMTMDQLVLAIMKMFFYTGTNNLVGDGKIKIRPGHGVQIVNGKIDWLEVPGPGKEAWDGLQFLKNGMDDDSGVTPTLQGAVTGQTLGETQLAKEAALKRLKVPLDNIAYAMEQDAYLTLSWMAQIYSTPEVRQFADLNEIEAYEQETGMARVDTTAMGGMDQVTGQTQGPYETSFLPEISLPLEKQGDKLIESRTDRFFKIGTDIPTADLKWQGIFKVVPRSIISSSVELEKQGKTELFSILVPLLIQPPELFAKPCQQIIRVREEDPQNWLPDLWIKFLQQDSKTQSLFVPTTPPMPATGAETGMGQGVPSNQTSMQGAAGTTPGLKGPRVVPQQQVNTPKAPGYSATPRQELTRQQ